MTAGMSAELPFIEYGGRIVAIAGRTRCYFAVDDLDAATLNFVAVMCLCKREVDEGRIEGPFNSGLAAQWARLVMIGPHGFAGPGRATTRSHGGCGCRSSRSRSRAASSEIAACRWASSP
jgi:hypothetical protein